MADMSEIRYKRLAARVVALEAEAAVLRGHLRTLATGALQGDTAAAQSVLDALQDDEAAQDEMRAIVEAGPPPGE